MALEIYNESQFYKARNEFILQVCVRRANFFLFFFMRARRRERSNFSEVAMKFLTVYLHKTAIHKDLTQNFRGLRGVLSKVMLFVVC